MVALLALTACDLSTSPERPPIPPIDVALDFCSDEIPVWIAYAQNGENWVRLTPNADGTVSFTAEYEVALAFVQQNGSDTRAEMIFTTNNVLSALSGRTCREESGTKTLNGSVTGFSGAQKALVSMGVSSVYRLPGQNSFTLGGLPTRSLDVMASRMNFVGTTEQHANRTILRRSQNLVNGSTMAPLDFDASEAITPTTATIAVTGVPGDDRAFLANNFFSQLETTHLMAYYDAIGNASYQVEALPSASTAAGDYHDAFVASISPNGDVRGVERYFRSPGSQTLAVGPEMAAPLVSTISTTPTLRMRMQAAGSFDYPSAISVQYNQQLQFSANTWIITVTNGYFGGTPQLWDLDMPDMTGAPGWQNSWGLQNGDVSWMVTAYGARAELLLGAAPIENEVVRYAIRFSAPPALARRAPLPPRPFTPATRLHR